MTDVPVKKKRRLLRWLIMAVLLALLFSGLSFLALQTAPAKRFMAAQVNGIFESSFPWPAELRGIGGFLPFVLTVDSLRLGDEAAPWLTLNEVALNLSMLPLLSGKVSIERLGAEEIIFHQLPPASSDAPQEPTPFYLPSVPDLPLWLQLDALEINRVTIDEAVLGQALAFEIQGAYLPDEEEALALRVEGVDGTRAQVALSGALRDGSVNLVLDLSDSTLGASLAGIEGTVAMALTVSGAVSNPTVHLSVTRDGIALVTTDLTIQYGVPLRVVGPVALHLPADLVPAVVREKLGEEVSLALDVSLDEGYTVSLTETTVETPFAHLLLEGSYGIRSGQIALTPALSYDDFNRLLNAPAGGEAVVLKATIPVAGALEAMTLTPEISLGGAAWIGGSLDVGLGAPITAKGAINVQEVGVLIPEQFRALMTDGGALTVDVSYADRAITVNNTGLRVGSTVLNVAGAVNTAQSNMDVRVTGQVDDLGELSGVAGRPLGGAITLDLVAKGNGDGTTVSGTFDVNNVTADTVKIPTGSLAVDVVAGAFPDGLTERIETTLKGDFPGLALSPELQRDLTLAGVVTLEALERLQVASFTLSDGNVNATADGTIDLASRNADFTSQITIAEIGDYANMAKLPYRGAAAFLLDVASGDTPGSLVARIDGSLKDLDGLPNEIAGVTGPTITLASTARYDGTKAEVDDLSLSGAGISTTGTGSYHMEEKSLQASVEGSIDDISPFSGLAKRPLSGAANFTVTASGPVDNLAVDGEVRGENLNLDVVKAEGSEIRMAATGIPSAINADLEVTLSAGEESLVLRSTVAQKAGILQIAALELVAGDNQVSATGRIDTTSLEVSGDIAAALPNLAALTTWVNLPLEGSLTLGMSVAESTGALTGALTADSLVLDALSLEHAEGSFDIADIYTAPAGTLTFVATKLDAGDVALTTLNIDAEGPPSGLVLALKTEGVYQEFTRFNVDAGGLISNETLSFDLRDLNLGLEAYRFALREAATLSWKDGEILLTPVHFESESGNLTVQGSYTEALVDARAAWNDLSLGLVELVGIDPMAGMLTGSLTVTGEPGAPVVGLIASLTGYNPEPDDANDFPGLNGELTATISGGMLEATLGAVVPEGADFKAEAAMALGVSLSPWSIGIPDGAALSGRLQGTGDLAVLPSLLSLEGHDMDGDLEADLRLSGNKERPALDGAVTVADGYYENGSTSTILDDLALRLEAAGTTVRLTEFRANDTVGGTISGEGQWELDQDSGSPFDFTLTLDKPRLVHRDDLRTQGDGELRFKGDAQGAALTGNLVVGPAYIAIPESSGETEVTTVAYTEAHAAGEGEGEEKALPYEIILDMTLDFPGKVFVTGPGLDSEWDGKLHLRNPISDPSIEGVLRVKKGTLDFLGRVFTLAESTITFDGQTPPLPYLRIDAVTTTEEIEAHVRMEGTQDNLNLSLESDPSMPRDEILSRVLFGQRLSDVSPVQALTLARYAPMFKKNVSGRSVLGSQGPKPFLVDRISLNSGTEVGEASITTGKYLSDDFYLEFEQGLGSAESLVSLDWLFAPQWALKGKTTSTGEGGLGVFWKKNY